MEGAFRADCVAAGLGVLSDAPEDTKSIIDKTCKSMSEPGLQRRHSRRSFIKKGTMGGLVATVLPKKGKNKIASGNDRPAAAPVAISSGNGIRAVEEAVEQIRQGADALDAVVAGVNIVEADPEDITVGYGGLPNAEGVVELDAAVMHGPTSRAGAVASLRNIKHPSKVAKLVLERTDHCLLVGDGALEFARMHGFKEENLLTERSRKIWVNWRETLSDRDDYLPPHEAGEKGIGALPVLDDRPWGTIHCSAVDLNGNISSVTTTSGLAFKVPGRVGDSPIIGAGLYADNDVGAAGSTGRGEANLENLSCFLIVERMRAGDSPEEACLYTCRRIADHTRLARLQTEDGRPNFNVSFYALNKSGVVGGAQIYGKEGRGFAVADSDGSQHIQFAYLWESDD